MKKGSSGPPSRCSALNQVLCPPPLLVYSHLQHLSFWRDVTHLAFSLQVNPDRRRLRRGETVEVSSPSASLDGGPRLRERPLGRCHTLDSGEHTGGGPEPTHTDQSPQTGVTPDAASSTGIQTSRDDTWPDATETPETSPPSSPDAPADNSPHSPHTHTSHGPAGPSDPPGLRHLSRELESGDVRTLSEDADARPTCPDDPQAPVRPDGGQRDANQSAETEEETL